MMLKEVISLSNRTSKEFLFVLPKRIIELTSIHVASVLIRFRILIRFSLSESESEEKNRETAPVLPKRLDPDPIYPGPD